MAYAIAAGGLIGTYLLAYALLDDRGRLTPRGRWIAGVLGFVLAATLWIMHPDISGTEPDGSSLADQWP